jgi:hypothetical protein
MIWVEAKIKRAKMEILEEDWPVVSLVGLNLIKSLL